MKSLKQARYVLTVEGAVTLLFQQFEIAFRQCVFPFGFGMPHVNPAVINIGVGRIAVVKIRQAESG